MFPSVMGAFLGGILLGLALAILGGSTVLAVEPPFPTPLVLHGVGQGTYQSFDGSFVCPDARVGMEAVYWPGDKGSLQLGIAGPCVVAGMALVVGVTVSVGASPPVQVSHFCTGVPEAGMHCEYAWGGGTAVATLGPYPGEGGTVALAHHGPFLFHGVVTVV